jgi:hypothetical protein
MRGVSRVFAVASASCLLVAPALLAQRAPSAPARNAPPAVDRRPPLDPSRSVYLENASSSPGALTPVRTMLRDAHLWTIRDRRDGADLVMTLRAATVSASRQPQRPAFELTVQSARAPSAAPLWHAVEATPEALAKRLKGDLAPSVCVVVWCR